MLLRVSVLLSFIVLTGCEDSLTLAKICEQTPAFCNDLNKDSHCKKQRADVIMARYLEYKKPTDENKYQLLKSFEKYDKCVSLAAKIEHIKLKEKTTSRVEGHLTSIKEIYRIFQETKETNHPGLLYYHWSRNNDQSALTKFLSLEDDENVANSAEMQFFLASYYIKFDDEKTIDLLYRTLELNKAGEIPNPEVYTSLISLFYKHEKYKHAYTFARIAQMAGVNNIELIPLEHKLTAAGSSIDSLNTLAQQTYEKILAGEFVSPRSF
ncbi:DUF2989 domain-containing protein [Pseudoalteromonas mariniglutinosa]|uniref:DUF2989 domain-containing protein n=1 Tax=Pseudoalteromonas mariniglutinosa TaxID=206042 RepID=UPI0038512E10